MDDRRYHGLDALRGGMMMLGIVLHAAMLYLADPPATMPIPTDRGASPAFDVVFAFIHAFRMPLFFVLAGFFAALLVEKRGVAGTLRNRAARILGPLAAGIVTILPVTALLFLDFMLAARFGTRELLPDHAAMGALREEIEARGVPTGRPALLHLWFLYYLCFFYLLLPLLRMLARRIPPGPPRDGGLLASPALVIPLSLCTAATLWPFHGGQVHEGFIYFRPHPPSLLYYGSFFVLGYLLHARPGLLHVPARRPLAWAVSAAALFALSLEASAHDRAAAGGEPLRHLLAVVLNGFCTWALIYAFLGITQKHFDRVSPWIQYVSQSSYWVFLVHMPLVLLAGWWLAPYALPGLVKFVLVCGFTAAVAFASFHYAVQRTWVSQFLHGRRFALAWPWQARARLRP